MQELLTGMETTMQMVLTKTTALVVDINASQEF